MRFTIFRTILFFLLFLLTSCSVGSLFIGTLDNLLTSGTAERFHLYEKQKVQLSLDIATLLNEIKPEVKVILLQLEIARAQKKKQITPEIFGPTRRAFDQIWQKLTLLAGKYVSQLSKKQVSEFLKDLEKRNKKAKKKLKVKKLKENLAQKYDEIFDDLSDKQLELVAQNPAPYLAFKQHSYKVNTFMFNQLSQTPFNEAREENIQKVFITMAQMAHENYYQNLDPIIKEINLILDSLNKDQIKELNEDLDLVKDIMKSFLEYKY